MTIRILYLAYSTVGKNLDSIRYAKRSWGGGMGFSPSGQRHSWRSNKNYE